MSHRYSLLRFFALLFYFLGSMGALLAAWLVLTSLVAFSGYRGAYVDRNAALIAALLSAGGALVAGLGGIAAGQVIELLIEIHAALYPAPKSMPVPVPAPTS